jgi:hypothetical protein
MDARAAGFEVRVETSCCRGIDAGGSLGRALTAMKNAGVELA